MWKDVYIDCIVFLIEYKFFRIVKNEYRGEQKQYENVRNATKHGSSETLDFSGCQAKT